MNLKSKLVIYFEDLLNDNLIAYMEVLDFEKDDLNIKIKVYFPKIVSNICTFLNSNFGLENKENVIITRDKDGYHFVDVFLKVENERVGLRIQSMLKDTWGVDKNTKSF